MSMEYDNAQQLDMIGSDLVWADWRRGQNRALINSLANGDPPYTQEEAESGNVKVNFNNLKLCSLAHESRSTFGNGFFQQGQYITMRTDWAPKHKKDVFSRIVERQANIPLIESIEYFEALQNKFASLVLHGIAPSIWRNSYELIPEALSVGDLLCPTNTLRGFRNLPIIFVRKSFTAKELCDLTNSAKRDPGWNMDFVNKCLKWVDNQMKTGLASDVNEYYKPEKWNEQRKQDAGWYMPDRVPTIDVFDIYAYVEATSKNKSGWVRRIIIDSWSNSGPATSSEPARKERDIDKTAKENFLYHSKLRPVADSWQSILSVQYGDLSAVAPFMHNSVRGLGWLQYAKCHIDNRFDCRLYDSGFEQLMQYFECDSMDDVQRAMKVELANMGFIDKTIKMVPASQRWQPNAQFIEMVAQQNKNQINDSAKSWTQQMQGGNSKTEKTKFQYMAELQQMAAMVSSALNLAYMYQRFEDKEMVRRLMIPNSKDPLVRTFRENCLRQGIPEKLLNSPEAWDVQHEKMMGQGNQTLEMMVASELLQMAPGLPPEAQSVVKRNYIVALTHNPQMAMELVPDGPEKVTSATEEASRVCSGLMQSIPADMIPGTNPIEYIGAALNILGIKVQAGMQSPGKMVDAKELQGLKLIANNIAQHIQQIQPDQTQAQFVKQAGDALGKLTNEIKGFEQRLQAAMKKQQGQNGEGNGAEIMGKVLPAIIAAKVKAKIEDKKASQKIQHKNIEFHQNLAHKEIQSKANVAAKDLETAANINRGGMKSFDEGEE